MKGEASRDATVQAAEIPMKKTVRVEKNDKLAMAFGRLFAHKKGREPEEYCFSTPRLVTDYDRIQ